MHARRTLAGLIIAVAPLASCGREAAPDPDADEVALPAPAAAPVVAAPDVAAPDVAAPDVAAPGRRPVVAAPARSAQQPAELEQTAIWPAADLVFATPEEAAADFVGAVLISDGEPALGEFQQGDSRSGEIAVQFAGEEPGSDPSDRGLLLMRRLGPDDGWFVLAAVSDGASISSPADRAVVPAGPLVVEGEAAGFEGTILVSAFPAGHADQVLDVEIASGGALGTPEPYTATLDLSGAAPGAVLTLLVQGDRGLGSDPGTFAAFPIVIERGIPPTR